MEKKIKLNEELKKISNKKYHYQHIYIAVIYAILTLVFYFTSAFSLPVAVERIANVNFALLAANLLFLTFVLPMFFQEKIKVESEKRKILDLKVQGNIKQPHLEYLKDVNKKLLLTYKALNFIYFQTFLLIVTFSISYLIFGFSSNEQFVSSISASHVIIEIMYLINIFIIMGIFAYTRNLEQVHLKMQTDEINLLNNSGRYSVFLSDKQINKAKAMSKKSAKAQNTTVNENIEKKTKEKNNS